jgi:ABC-type amino acid transport substrate-binding protein
MALSVVATGASGGTTLDRIKQTGKITLAHRESSVPFSYVLPDKRPVGYALDLCLKVAEAVRKKVNIPTLVPQYLLVTPSTRVAAIAEGKADMECGSTTNNAERRQKVAFTVPHYITGARFMVLTGRSADSLADFSGKKLVSTQSTTSLKVIEKANEERLMRIGILQAPDHATAVDMVESGAADGFAMDDVLLYGLIASRPNPAKFKVVGNFLTIEPLAIMLSKDDPEFKAIVDDEMKRLITSHEADALYEKWFMRPIPPKNVAMNLPMNYLIRDLWKYPSADMP